jgi:hypothetical protein
MANEDARVLSSTFEYNDKSHMLRRYLHNLVDWSNPHMLHHYNLACQYQLCEAGTGDLRQQHHYGWLVVGSQSIGVGSWGEVESKLYRADFFLHHVGVAIFPYVLPSATPLPGNDPLSVRAVDLSLITPFSVDQFLPYSREDCPHEPTAVAQRHPDVNANNGRRGGGDSRIPREQAAKSTTPLSRDIIGQSIKFSGCVDEEDLLSKSRIGGVEFISKQFPIPTRADLNAITMNPLALRIPSDTDWLESHVQAICGGQLPPLVGRYDVKALHDWLDAKRRGFVGGWELLSSSLENVGKTS